MWGPAPEFGGVCEFEDRFMRPGEVEVVGQLFPEGLVVAEDIAEDVVAEAPRVKESHSKQRGEGAL